MEIELYLCLGYQNGAFPFSLSKLWCAVMPFRYYFPCLLSASNKTWFFFLKNRYETALFCLQEGVVHISVGIPSWIHRFQHFFPSMGTRFIYIYITNVCLNLGISNVWVAVLGGTRLALKKIPKHAHLVENKKTEGGKCLHKPDHWSLWRRWFALVDSARSLMEVGRAFPNPPTWGHFASATELMGHSLGGECDHTLAEVISSLALALLLNDKPGFPTFLQSKGRSTPTPTSLCMRRHSTMYRWVTNTHKWC